MYFDNEFWVVWRYLNILNVPASRSTAGLGRSRKGDLFGYLVILTILKAEEVT